MTNICESFWKKKDFSPFAGGGHKDRPKTEEEKILIEFEISAGIVVADVLDHAGKGLMVVG